MMRLPDFYLVLKSDIEKIEHELEKSVATEQPVLNKAALHLLQAGGKRIRPIFVLLCAKFGAYDIEKVKHIASALEMIHMGSLVHDDVIDDAELRRGRQTIKAKWDNRVAMYTGDFLFARAVEKASFLQNGEVHQILSKAMIDMCVGEIEQIRDQFNWQQHLKTYLRRIKRKTALLIAVSCQLGALSADVPPSIQRQLYYYGYNVGMSFQIMDDVLDFIGTEEELGKPAGSDLLQGNITLPALYAMQKDDELKKEVIRLANGDEVVSVRAIIEEVKTSGGIEYAKKLSKKYLDKAYDSLDGLPNRSAKKSLVTIASYIGKRTY